MAKTCLSLSKSGMKFEPPQMDGQDPGTPDKNDWLRLAQKCPYKQGLQCSAHEASCKDENCPILFIIRVRIREGTH
jgi:hypothetical protein